MNNIRCDIAIIGAGSAGLTVAAVAGQLGLKVILIEHNKMGGECLNSGCVPSKALLAAAHCAYTIANAKKFGIETAEPRIQFSEVMNNVANVIAAIAPNDSTERFIEMGVQVIKAHGKFIDQKTLQAGDLIITARQFIVATGSSPAIPPIPGIKDIEYLTNESVFNLRTQPNHLIIIGAGPIGCELAQAFALLGVKVTVLEAATMMPRDEPELVAQLRKQLISQGITLYEQTKITNVKKLNNNIEISIDYNHSTQVITGSHLLVAAGRKVNVEQLDLELAGVEYTQKGIKVDKHLRSTNKKIYAIGDVAGSYQFTHAANYHATVVIKNIIFKRPTSVDYRALPWVTYTIPELAHVGLSESEALKIEPNAKIVIVPLTDNDRAQAEHNTEGKIKLIVGAKDKILGVSILSASAGELIVPWGLLIQNKLNLRHLTDTIVPYPTLSEINKRVASEYYKPILFSKAVRRLVAFLKYF